MTTSLCKISVVATHVQRLDDGKNLLLPPCIMRVLEHELLHVELLRTLS